MEKPEELKKYEYIEYDEASASLSRNILSHFHVIELLMLNNFVKSTRELSLARTKLEEAYMWIGKAIRSDQQMRNESQR